MLPKALAIERETGALAWELRSAMSPVCLRRSLQSQGEGSAADLAEAQQGLAEVYGRFSEGFDTLDLVEAKGLMDELE